MLIDHPSGIESDQHHFSHWLLVTNLLYPGFATMEPHLRLTFHLRIKMMNPGFVNSDHMRKSGTWEIYAKLSEHTEQCHSISSAKRKWGTHIEQTHFIRSSFIKMLWIDILRMCMLSASIQMDEWQPFSITADTVLMLTSITTVLSLPPICSISPDSLLCANILCHLRTVESCTVWFWKASFNRAILSTFDFFNSMQNFTVMFFGQKFIFLFMKLHAVWKQTLFTRAR